MSVNTAVAGVHAFAGSATHERPVPVNKRPISNLAAAFAAPASGGTLPAAPPPLPGAEAVVPEPVETVPDAVNCAPLPQEGAPAAAAFRLPAANQSDPTCRFCAAEMQQDDELMDANVSSVASWNGSISAPSPAWSRTIPLHSDLRWKQFPVGEDTEATKAAHILSIRHAIDGANRAFCRLLPDHLARGAAPCACDHHSSLDFLQSLELSPPTPQRDRDIAHVLGARQQRAAEALWSNFQWKLREARDALFKHNGVRPPPYVESDMSAKPDLSDEAGVERAVTAIFHRVRRAAESWSWHWCGRLVAPHEWDKKSKRCLQDEWDRLQYPLEAKFCEAHFNVIQPRYAVSVPPDFVYRHAPPAACGALIPRAHQPFHDAGCCIFVAYPTVDTFNGMFPSVAADASDVPVVTLLLGNLPVGATPAQIRIIVFACTGIDPEVERVHKTSHTATAEDVHGISLVQHNKGKPAKPLSDAQSARITVPAAAADFIKRALHKRVLVDSDGVLVCKPDFDSAQLFRAMVELRKHNPVARCQSLAYDALTCVDAKN